MLEVTDASYVTEYRILITFNTGEQGEVDLKESLWGTAFEALRDSNRFKCFQVSPVLHTLVWENNADLAPEFLHDKMLEQLHIP